MFTMRLACETSPCAKLCRMHSLAIASRPKSSAVTITSGFSMSGTGRCRAVVCSTRLCHSTGGEWAIGSTFGDVYENRPCLPLLTARRTVLPLQSAAPQHGQRLRRVDRFEGRVGQDVLARVPHAGLFADPMLWNKAAV